MISNAELMRRKSETRSVSIPRGRARGYSELENYLAIHHYKNSRNAVQEESSTDSPYCEIEGGKAAASHPNCLVVR